MANVIRQGLVDEVKRFVISYDIACKYGIGFKNRVSCGSIKLLDPDHLTDDLLCWLVPKFHLGGHQPSCADLFSFNYTKDVGHMSGELVETPWASLNWLQYSTREMGWGTRRDYLNIHFNHWNWKKIQRMGQSNVFFVWDGD